MGNKTIFYLNSKAWYRLLKVIYVFLLIIILLGYNLIFKTGLRNIDQGKTLIQCNVGTLKTFTPESIKLNLSESDLFYDKFDYAYFFKGYNDSKIRNILAQCTLKPPIDWATDDVFKIQRTYEIIGLKDAKKTYDKNYLDSEIKKITSGYKTNQEKASYLDFSVKFFDIKPVFTYDAFIKYFIIGNVIILFVFEIIKRTFYYIATGTVKPSK